MGGVRTGPRASGCARELEEVARGVLGELPQLTEELVTRILEHQQEYQTGKVPRAELRQSCLANLTQDLDVLLHTIRTGGDVPVVSHTAAAETGARRAEQGMPLHALLRAYRTGGRMLWEALVERATSAPATTTTHLTTAISLVWDINDQTMDAVASAFHDAQDDSALRARVMRAEAIDVLLGVGGGPEWTPDRAARTLDLPPTGEFLVVVAEVDANGRGLLRRAGARLADLGIHAVWRQADRRHIGIVSLCPHQRDDVCAAIAEDDHLRVGVSPAVSGLGQLVGARRQAETSLQTMPPGTHEVRSLDDCLATALLVEAPEIAARLRARVLGRLDGLEEDDRQLLLDTVAAFLRTGGSAGQAAELLYCHRNTVQNRLRRIESLLDLSLADPRVRLDLSLALDADLIVGDPRR